MQYILYTVYVLAIVGLNAGLLPVVSPLGTVGSLVLVSVLVLAVVSDDLNSVFFISMLGGLLWEQYTGLFPGSLIVGYSLAGVLVFSLSHRVFFIQDRIKYLPLFLLLFQGVVFVWVAGFGWFMARLYPAEYTIHIARIAEQAVVSLFFNFILLYPVNFVLGQIEHVLTYIKRARHIAD